MFADQHLRSVAGQFRRRELVFVVFLEGRRKFGLHGVIAEYRFDCLGDVRELFGVRESGGGGVWRRGDRTSPGGALSMKEERAAVRDILLESDSNRWI